MSCHLSNVYLFHISRYHGNSRFYEFTDMFFRSFRLASTVMGLVCGGIVENSKKFVLCGLFIPLIDMLCYNLNVISC